jgi:hypothetical protein
MILIQLLKRIFSTKENQKTQELQQKILELEAKVIRISNDNDFILKNMVMLTKSLTKIKRGEFILNEKADNIFNVLENYHNVISTQSVQIEEYKKIFNIFHNRLEAIEGYYFDQPLKNQLN